MAENKVAAQPPGRVEPMPGASPTRGLLLAGVAVVGGVLLLTMASGTGGTAAPGTGGGFTGFLNRLFGRQPTTPTLTPEQRAALIKSAQTVPAPTQPGISFRSGNVGGFIPIPFDKLATGLVSGIFSLFQPGKADAASASAAAAASYTTPRSVPVAELLRDAGASNIPSAGEFVQPDGSMYTAPDYGYAAESVYQPTEDMPVDSISLSDALRSEEASPDTPDFDIPWDVSDLSAQYEMASSEYPAYF